MATYVMSDLHGRFDRYQAMLEKIHFSDKDRLFILGDVCDRGPEGIKILLDMMTRNNVIPFMGNHELFLLSVGPMILDRNVSIEEIDASADFSDWMRNGGASTLKAFLELDTETENRILDYVAIFEGPRELEVGGQKFLLAHTAPIPARAEAWKDWDDEECLWSRDLDYQTRYYEDRILVTGHTPTVYIDKNYSGKIWKGNGHIALDCSAAAAKGRLGCICLETLKEFYT